MNDVLTVFQGNCSRERAGNFGETTQLLLVF